MTLPTVYEQADNQLTGEWLVDENFSTDATNPPDGHG